MLLLEVQCMTGFSIDGTQCGRVPDGGHVLAQPPMTEPTHCQLRWCSPLTYQFPVLARQPSNPREWS